MDRLETIALLTAIVVFVSAVVGLVAAVIKFMAKLDKGVSEIHVMVNSHAQAQSELIKNQGNRIEQLAAALRAAGVDVPDNHEHD